MTVHKISPEQLKEKIKNNKDVLVLDVRAEDKFNAFHIEQSMNIPKNHIFEQNEVVISTLPIETEIIVTCTTGNSARKCAEILAEKNYKVSVLEGGLTAWKENEEK